MAALFSGSRRRRIAAQSFDASTSDLNFATSVPAALNSDLAQTWLALCRPAGAGEGDRAYLASRIPAASADGLRFFIDHNAGSPTLAFGQSSSGAVGDPQIATGDITTSVTYTRRNWLAVTAAATVSATNRFIYSGLDNAPLLQRSLIIDTSGSGSLVTNSADEFHIGNRTGADRTFNGLIALVARWNRVLTLTELERARKQGPVAVPGLVLLFADGKDFGPSHLVPTVTAVPKAVPAPLAVLDRKSSRSLFFDAAVGAANTQPPRSMHQFRLRQAA